MKNINKAFLALGVAASSIGFSACVDDLNQTPTDPTTITDVANDMDRVFADIYLQFATYGANGSSPVMNYDGGMATFQRAVFTAEEIPTDEACWLWDPDTYGQLNYGYSTPSLPAVFGFYSRMIVNIALCNSFIQQCNDGTFTDGNSEKAQQYILQARALRGACYYYMLSFYENPPFADETTPIGAEPSQPGRAWVYNWVTEDLEDVVATWKASPVATNYGFVGLDMAESVLAKIYLNGEVFSGTADYAKCYEHSKAVIDRLGNGGYYGNGLARSYSALFGYNNDQYAIGGANAVNEIIWTIPASKGDGVNNLTSWAGATFMIAAWNGTNGVNVTVACPTQDAAYANKTGEELLFTDADGVQHIYEYVADADAFTEAKKKYDEAADWEKTVSEFIANVAYSFDPSAAGNVSGTWFNATEGWKSMVARKSFVRKFDWNDVLMSDSDDSRVRFWQTSAHGFVAENPSLVGDDWGNNGYLAMKYTNWVFNEDGTINYDASAAIPMTAEYGGDFAAIRLAEVYLMAAEAILNGGGGSQSEALQYVNYIRQRAMGDNYSPWTSLSMQDLRDERARELYTENVRRTDLIRWNQWCTNYTWEWKGNVASGTNLPEYTKSYPIPLSVLTASSLKQCTGY